MHNVQSAGDIQRSRSYTEIPLISSQTYSFVIVKILFEGFSCLRMNAFVRNIRIFLVTRAFVILATMCFPISKAHPAEVVLTIVTLHMIATAVLLNADVTLWTLQNFNTLFYADLYNGLRYIKHFFEFFVDFFFIEDKIYVTHIFGMSTNVICRFRIICTFCQPFFNCTAIGRCMIIHATPEAGSRNVIIISFFLSL